MNSRAGRWGFALFDFSSSSYILIFNAFLFPLFVRNVVFDGAPVADAFWGTTLSASLAIAVLLSPLVGRFADRSDRRKVLLSLVGLTSVGLALLVTLPVSNASAYMVLFGLTNLFYVVSLTVYDSFLSILAEASERPRLSGFAWGFGYVGGILCLLTIAAVQGGFEPTRLALGISAAFYVLSAVIALGLLPSTRTEGALEPLPKLAGRLLKRSLLLLILGFLFINEGIDIVIYFTSIYAEVTLGLSSTEIGAYLLAVQALAFPATWWLGILAGRYGEPRVINLTLLIWSGIVVGAVISQRAVHFLPLALGLAFVIGSSQALMRSYFSRQFRNEDAGFGFGVYSLISRATSLFGPAIFGFVSAATGNQRLAMLTVIPFLLLGGLLFTLSLRQGD